MREFLEKLARVERQIAEAKGDFSLFALFLREDAPGDRWDLVVAAPWIGEDKWDGLRLIATEVQSHLTREEVIRLSGVIVVEPTDPSVQEINQAFQVEHGNLEFRDREYFGLPIRHAYIITSKQDLPTAA